MLSDGRLVWITREQRDEADSGEPGGGYEVVTAWDSAPSDPAEAIAGALTGSHVYTPEETYQEVKTGAYVDALAVLAALGVSNTT